MELILLIAMGWGLAFFRVTRVVWAVVFGLGLLAVSFLFGVGWGLSIVWAVFLLLVTLLNISFLRRHLVTSPCFKYFRRILPVISETERAALEAGDVWWEGDLFSGRPDWKKLLALPTPELTKDEQAFIDGPVEMLCHMLNDWEVDQSWNLPDNVWDYIKAERFFGLVMSQEYGGHGFSAFAHSVVVSKLVSRCLTAAFTVMVPNSLGPAELIHRYGTPAQKKKYLSRFVTGDEIPCFALTSPVAGSDANAIEDTGIVCRGEYAGKEVVGIRLQWDKRYITLAPIATIIALAFKLYDPEHLLGDQEDLGITLALVPADADGVERGTRHLPFNFAFLNGPIRGHDVFVPLDAIVGGAEMRGKGWRMLMECLSVGRGISIPAIGTGTAQLCYRMTGAYAKCRRQFKIPIGEFEGVASALAQIGGLTYLTQAVRMLTTTGIDQGIKPANATAITKCHVSAMSRTICEHAMDVHAGRAIQLGPRNYLSSVFHAAPISVAVEGANILTRNLIIFGQGAIRCHPYVQQEMQAAQDKNRQRGLKTFDTLFFSHVGYAVSNVARCIVYGLTGGRFIRTGAQGQLGRYYKQMTRMSCALAWVSDVAMLLLGGELKRRENISARLGDVLSHLYLASACLKYYNDFGKGSQADRSHVKWVLQTSLHNIQVAFDGFFANFPNRFIARLLKLMVFPWGRVYALPTDRLSQSIVDEMLSPSNFRDRITQYSFVSHDKDDVTGRMENALLKVIVAEPMQKKFDKAVRAGQIPRRGKFSDRLAVAIKANAITEDEAKYLQGAHDTTRDAMQVDEFAFDEFRREKTE